MSMTLTLPRGGAFPTDVSEPIGEYTTPEEYLRREKSADTKSEYEDGCILPMAGVKLEHQILDTDLRYLLMSAVALLKCLIAGPDLRVHVTDKLYYYPDMIIVCQRPQMDKDNCLLNPLVIIEILSSSTEARDKGIKFTNYQQIASLREYVLVAQETVRVERWTRQADDTWHRVVWEHLEDTATLTAVPSALPLAQIYGRLHLAEDDTAERSDNFS